jgi:putative PEP-CTERM system TPR-repeat lipoprotein
VRPALARALLAQGKFAEVLDLAHMDLGATAASDLVSSKALAELASGKVSEAEKLVALALEKNPQSDYAKLVEARLLASQGDATGALIVLEEVLEVTPDSDQAWRLKGDILMQQGVMEEARGAFDQSIIHSRVTYGDRVKRALINLQLQDYEAAQADATELLRLSPEHPAANYVQGLIHFQRQEYEPAITALSVAEPAANQYPLVWFYLGSAHLISGNRDQAAMFASQFFNIAPDNINGRKLLATIRLQEGKVEEVQELMQPVLVNNPDDVGALNLMANALLRDGQTDQGLDLLARIAQLQPDSPVAQLRLGAGMMISGKGEEASEHLATALDINPEFQQADILLVLNHLQKQDYEGAIEAAKAYQRRNIGKVAPYNVLGRVYLAAGRPDDAREAFGRALKFEPGDPSANLSLAQMALSADDPVTARQHYQTVLDHHPDNLPTLLQLAALEAREQNEEAMVAWLQQAIKKHPAVLEPRLMLARYYLGSGQADQVAPLFADLDDMQRRSRPVLEMTALAQLAGQQHAVAHATLDQLIASNPDTAHYHYLLAMAAGGEGDQRKAKTELLQAHQLDGNHVPTLVALARLSLVEQAPEQFEQYLDTLLTLAPEAPDVLRLQAIAAQRAGDTDEALAHATRAYTASPGTQTLLELVGYQKLAGQDEEARKSLQQWIGEHPEDVAVRLALANDLQVENNLEGAQAQYTAVVKLDPDNVMALNNLAWNLRLEDPAKALDYIRRAAQAAPERAEVLDTLAVIEHLNGENRLAHRNIQRALAAAPDNLSMRYHKAMIEAALGEKEQAATALESLLAEGEFPERAEAEKLLASLRG